MADIARGIVLPGLGPPSAEQLKTLSLYWDQLIVPDYVDRSRELERPRELSQVEQRLQEEGLLQILQRGVDAGPYFASAVDLGGDGPLSITFKLNLPDELRERYAPAVEALRERVARPLSESPMSDIEECFRMFLSLLTADDAWSAWCAAAAEHYLQRMRDARELAYDQHLAQLALSAVEHVGSLIPDAPQDELKRECTLLTVVIDSFAIDPNTPVDDLLLFRRQNAASLGRLRASLADLAQRLNQAGSPSGALAAARDTYLNRVEPALEDLESVVKENKIAFFLKSIVGASALALTPLAPVTE
jgi:hypothetical protein